MTNMATIVIQKINNLSLSLIDLHSHILPGIDDGARSIEDTLAIAENTIEAGVTHMMCTPHIHLGTFDNSKTGIVKVFQETIAIIKSENLPLKLAIGSEVRICHEIVTMLESDSLPFIGHYRGKKVLLLELPHSHIPAGSDILIKWLLQNGIQPVIPHPERNRDIISNYSKAKWLKQLGCMFQITAGAFIGRFSDSVEGIAWQMQKDKLITYIASDTHNVNRRPNDMGLAYDSIATKLNKTVADALFVGMPNQITLNVKWL